MTSPRCLLLILLVVAIRSAEQPRLAMAQLSAPPAEMLEDATLKDVFFVDADQGWAVGDRGTIWKTEDGGRRWVRQVAPIACCLEAIHFVDSQTGWIVGAHTQPYTYRSRGVVLHTRDGGQRWAKLNVTLPGLKRVGFFDERQGWAVGFGSSLYGAGIFTTNDGGRSWGSRVHDERYSWVAADLQDPRRGVLVGRNGVVHPFVNGQLRPSFTVANGGRHVRDVQIREMVGWLVGDGGLVRLTKDGGVTWQEPAGALPEGEQCDFYAVACRGSHCWITGAPGSVIFHTADHGASWKALPTEQTAPIYALHFVDQDRGWAVGALGTILATRDGGQHWKPQRGEGRRSALLTLCSEPHRVPWEALAKLSGDEGYRCAIEALNRRDLEMTPAAETDLDTRLREAATAIGACDGRLSWNFPVRQPGLHLSSHAIIAGWNRVHQGEGLEQLEQHVVRLIRQWQPDLILTEPVNLHGEQPLSHSLNQVVLSAVQRAADEDAYSEQIQRLHLRAWQVKKVFAVLEDQQQGTISLATDQVATRLGRCLADHAIASRGLVGSGDESLAPVISFQLLSNTLPQNVAQHDFFSGLRHEPGSPTRRKALPPAASSLDALSRIAQRRRNAQRLIAAANTQSATSAAWLAQVEDLTKGLDTFSGGLLLHQLAQGYMRSGQLELAADALQLLTQRYPEHALTESALLWLVHYQASGEISHSSAPAQIQAYEGRPELVQPAPLQHQNLQRLAASASELAQASFEIEHAGTTIERKEIGAARSRRVLELIKTVERTHPALLAEPSLRFPLLVAQRHHPIAQTPDQSTRQLLSAPLAGGWKACVEAELWLENRSGDAPKALFSCASIRQKPLLDGVLDDVAWQEAQLVELRSALHDDGDWPAAVLLAHDGEYFYLAANCRKATNAKYQQPSELSRPRDPDLQEHDRIELLLDIDRDYVSWYRFTIDYRGWAAESCWQNTLWNPQWFVAAREDAEGWTVEAAIPLKELTPDKLPGQVWALGIQRVVPGVGLQSWTQPATVAGQGEGMGLVVFEGP